MAFQWPRSAIRGLARLSALALCRGPLLRGVDFVCVSAESSADVLASTLTDADTTDLDAHYCNRV